jgi:transposase
MLPVGFRKKVEWVISIPRICCRACGAVKQIALPFADPKKQYTRALERCVVDLCRITTLQHVAELTGLGWDTVKAIHQQHLQRTYKAINLKSVR